MNDRNGAKWIWVPGFTDTDKALPGKFVLFRKEFDLAEAATEKSYIRVSADTRYRLFVNGSSVAFGPCKSYPSRWYYETIDVTSLLRVGINTITARVLRFFPDQIGSSSLMRANVPGFILWGQVGSIRIATDESWLCCEDVSIQLKPRSEWNYLLGPPFLSLDERVNFSKAQLDWQKDRAILEHWSFAETAIAPVKMMPAMEPWKLYERPIPMLPEVPRSFSAALKSSDRPNLEEWTNLLFRQEACRVAPEQEVFVEFETAALTTGFLEFDFVGGNGAEIAILYAESYEKDLGIACSPFPIPRQKGNRRDFDGRLYGNEDHVVLSGADCQCTRYEPFWFRTFRFIRLSIKTKADLLIVERVAFRETHYPLDITTKVDTYGEIWQMCINTLRNCMHETYEDCPYYEQNQFAMDGRLQMLFTYQLSRDDRLARKTIHEFYASQREDGLLETNFPVSFRAINIPQFSLFWILMLHDHMLYFGDRKLIRRYIGAADGILDHFDRLVNQDGLVGAFDSECWAFVDWVKEWQGRSGIRDMAVPPIYKKTGVAAYNSLLYAWVLQHAAMLCDFINRSHTAAEYRNRAKLLNEAVKEQCWNGEYFVDGPGSIDICEHTQIFAILSGVVSGEEAKALMHRTMQNSAMPKCSFAMKHYVFRALEQTGLYSQYFNQMMEPWHQMVKDDLTTCAEDDVSFRSDCHGWSASPIYEIVALLYGIRPGKPGFGTLEIRPRRDLLPRAQITYQLPDGHLSVSWEETGDIEVVSKTDIGMEVQAIGSSERGME